MKKLLPIIVIALIVVIYFMWFGGTSIPTQGNESASSTDKVTTQAGSDSQNTAASQDEISANDDMSDIEADAELIPATDKYKNADEAFSAIQAGVKNFNDAILEQFAEVGEDCTWCDELYQKLIAAMRSDNVNNDQRGYYAEILASTGKPENIEALIAAMKDSEKDQDQADVYAEAISNTLGDDKTVQFLSNELTNLNSSDNALKEALVSAITNHGTPLAVAALYEETVKNGDPDGFYSFGIGLGELVPDEESLQPLAELVGKRDEYSHLAVKALLNYGTDGLRLVMNALEQSSPDEAKKLLKDAIDHVSYEDDTKKYAEEIVKTAKNPATIEFANEIIEEFKEDEDEEVVDELDEEDDDDDI